MQKLVTIYLNTESYGKGKWLGANLAELHGTVEEHLTEYLEDGWRVVHLTNVGAGGGETMTVQGWVVAVLEK